MLEVDGESLVELVVIEVEVVTSGTSEAVVELREADKVWLEEVEVVEMIEAVDDAGAPTVSIIAVGTGAIE